MESIEKLTKKSTPEEFFAKEIMAYKIILDNLGKGAYNKENRAAIQSAKKDLNIDMNKSYFIGNSEVDYNTALNAGVKSIIIRNKLFNIKGAIKKKNLLQAVRQILKKENS